MADVRPGFATAASKLPTRVRARGAGEVLSLAWGRLKETIRSDDTLLFLLAETSGSPPMPPSEKTRSLEFRAARPEDGPRYARDIGTDSAATFGSRLTAATRCYLVLDGDLIVHATWVTTAGAWLRELATYFEPPAGDAYIYESFTRAEVRGRGVYPFALGNISRTLTHEVRRLWVGVEAHNSPSFRAITKAGFSTACEVSYRRRLGRLRVDLASGPRGTECEGALVRTIRK